MILELGAPDPARPTRRSWLMPAAAGALLAVTLFVIFGGRGDAEAGIARPAAATAATELLTRRYVPLSQDQLAARAGLAVLSLPPAVATVSQRTLSSGVTGLVRADAVAPGVQVTFILSDGRIVTLVESTDDVADPVRPLATHLAEQVTIRGVPGIAYTAQSRDQASSLVWNANGVRFELWSRTVETAQLRRLAEMLG